MITRQPSTFHETRDILGTEAMAQSPGLRLPHNITEQAKFLTRVRDDVLSGGCVNAPIREVIWESWCRSLAARVDPDSHSPAVMLPAAQLNEFRSLHPLAQVLPLLRSTLVSIAEDAMHVMVVTDADGNILWLEGANEVRSSADSVGLSEGTRCSEASIGTNAMGTAIAVNAPVQVFSSEHLVRTYQNWTCVAAPVHDPDTDGILGAIDISGPLHTAHPAVLSLITATARLAEEQLRLQMSEVDERLRKRNMRYLQQLGEGQSALVAPSGRVLRADLAYPWPERVDPTLDRVTLADGNEALLEPLPEGYLLRVLGKKPRPARQNPLLRIRFLGEWPSAELDGKPLHLTTKRAETLALLALFPDGLSAAQLALHMYGNDGSPATARAEVHRLRRQLGPTVIWSNPYRLCADVEADFRRANVALRSGNLHAAVEVCQGPLLPYSESPTIRSVSAELVAGLRRAAIDSAEADLLWTLVDSSCGRDDLELHEILFDVMPAGDPRLHVVRARIQRLLDEE